MMKKQLAMMNKHLLVKTVTCSLLLGICYLSCKNPVVTELLPENPRLLWGAVVIGGNNWAGETLTADTSKLGGSGIITYQWKRGDTGVGTNSSAYSIETADEGQSITVTVRRSENSGTVTSNAVTAVLQPLGSGTIPVLGINKIGETLTVDTGGISGGGGTLSFQWQADGVDIPGAAGISYTIKGGDAGKTIICVIQRPDATGNLVTQALKVPYTITIYYPSTNPPTAGDSVTAMPDTGNAGDTITLNYTVADTNHYNLLEFEGINTAAIAPVTAAGIGTRIYTVNPADSDTGDGEIIIEAVFEHTDLQPDPIAFTDTSSHIFKNYGDPFTNVVTNAHNGSGIITYSSSHEEVATVDSGGVVTIFKAGTTVITAEKPHDGQYAHASHSYTLTVTPRPFTIIPDPGQGKVYGTADPLFSYALGETLMPGNTVSGALSRIQGEVAGSYPFTLGTLTAGSNYSLALDGNASFEIAKAAGAAISILPAAISVLASGDTTGSVTVDTIAASANGQAVEYAIGTSGGEDPANLVWQGAPTFTGLSAGTVYYAYARTAENANYMAGAASVSVAISFYNLVFAGNGNDSGAVPPAQAALAGAGIVIPGKGSLARTGYNFVSWNANTGGTGNNYVPGDWYTVTANTSLYARWGGEQNFSFSVQDIANNDPVLNAQNITLSHSDTDMATAAINVSGAYDSIEWFYGSIPLGTGSPLLLNVTDYRYNLVGAHNITVIGTLSGVPFNSNIRFIVVE